MKVVGLTGGIATGKSVVEKQLQIQGFSVIDADQVAREIVLPGKPATLQIERVFGAKVITRNGGIDRARLRKLIFDDPDEKAKLEAITHPKIMESIRETLDTIKSNGKKLAICSAALLFETNMDAWMDKVVLTSCNEKTQLERLIARDAVSKEQAQKIIDSQLPDAERRKNADYIVETDGSLDQTLERVDRLTQWLRQLEQEENNGQPA